MPRTYSDGRRTPQSDRIMQVKTGLHKTQGIHQKHAFERAHSNICAAIGPETAQQVGCRRMQTHTHKRQMTGPHQDQHILEKRMVSRCQMRRDRTMACSGTTLVVSLSALYGYLACLLAGTTHGLTLMIYALLCGTLFRSNGRLPARFTFRSLAWFRRRITLNSLVPRLFAL